VEERISQPFLLISQEKKGEERGEERLSCASLQKDADFTIIMQREGILFLCLEGKKREDGGLSVGFGAEKGDLGAYTPIP